MNMHTWETNKLQHH